MKDIILNNLLINFSEQYQISSLPEDEQFEHFANFNIVSKLYPREIENIEYLSTGGGEDTGIDGCAIIVNNSIVSSVEEIDDLLKLNGTLTVKFIFIQSKNQDKFESDKVGTFIFGVRNFFENDSHLRQNEKIKELRKLKEKIYKHSVDFSDNPELQLFFVTTGKWKDPTDIVNRANKELEILNQQNLFKNIPKIDFYDSDRLQTVYKEISRRFVKEVRFDNSISLPDTLKNTGVKQSLIGSMAVTDFIKLISDSDDNLLQGLFFDNVRDFQGENKINKEISSTIESMEYQELLPLMNNGITIIAKQAERTGQKIKLTDFQIVNGCQSSNILFKHKDKLSNNTHIIVKIIETADQDIINKIIKATNRQTEVKDEAFEALKPFHKVLEDFYLAQATKSNYPIYYERRSKQYLGSGKIKAHQVITLSNQIKTYVATVFEQPQSTHRYYGELLNSNRNKMFKHDDKGRLIHYYLSAYILNRLEYMFSSGLIYKRFKNFRYHIVFLSYIDLCKRFKINDDLMEKIADDVLKDIFIKSCKTINLELKKYSSMRDYDLIRSKDFTQKIKQAWI